MRAFSALLLALIAVAAVAVLVPEARASSHCYQDPETGYCWGVVEQEGYDQGDGCTSRSTDFPGGLTSLFFGYERECPDGSRTTGIHFFVSGYEETGRTGDPAPTRCTYYPVDVPCHGAWTDPGWGHLLP